MNIAIATYATRNLAYFWQRVRPVNQAYAELHDCSYMTSDQDDKSRHPSWMKLLLAKALLKYPKLDYLWVVDADLMIMNHTIAIADIIEQNQGYDIIASSDAFNSRVSDRPNLNTGSMIFRNTEWTKQFLDWWWVSVGDYSFERFHEQTVINQMIAADPRLLEHIKILPEKAINGCFPRQTYEQGDFVVHLMQHPDSDRLRLFEQYAQELVLPPSPIWGIPNRNPTNC